MGRELGRISGPLLAENLRRNGHNLAFESKLLYFDVVNQRIGINSSVPTRDLLISGTAKTDYLLVDTEADLANLEFTSNQIQNVVSSITISPNQSSNPTIVVPRLTVGQFNVTDNTITNTVADSDIAINVTGSGQIHFTTTSVEVLGDLHATGDITWDGDITLGQGGNDTVNFRASIGSDIIPQTDNFYDIGTSSAEWSSLYAHNVVTPNINISTGPFVFNGVDLLLSQSNTIYVSVNGNDSNIGTHQHATFRTLKQALSAAVSGDEIVIFPGTYTEIFPLTVPQGVIVRGSGLRGTIIQPTVETNKLDAFLLNGETQVTFLTVQNFFFDAVNNTGYGFRFAPGIKVTTKSPYVYQCSVITTGSVTTADDPRGFNAGDAGAGVYIDGSVVDPSSANASGLFYATTLITPNQNGLTVTNGSRVEWVNGFTYFSKVGISVLAGSIMRSINSANVFGLYGTIADGANSIGYIVGHNFGYVGSGGDAHDDAGLVNQANEVVETNGGRVYYDSVDQGGNFRIGDIFYVDQATGNVTFNAQALNFTAAGQIALNGSDGGTLIEAVDIQVGNIRLHDNNIDSLVGPVNFLSYSGTTTLNTNVGITGNLSVSGDTNIKGSVVTFGNQSSDTVTIADYLTQTIKPKTTNLYTLGSSSLKWRNLYLKLANLDGIQISGSTVASITPNTNLSLVAVGAGAKVETSASALIDNSLTVTTNVGVSGTSSFKNTFTKAITQTGDFNQTGSTHVTGNVQSRNIRSVSGILVLPKITIDGSTITQTESGTDLTVTANGSGKIVVPTNNVQITNNLNVLGTLNVALGSSFGDVNAGAIGLTGNYGQTGNTSISGTIHSASIQIPLAGNALYLPQITIRW